MSADDIVFGNTFERPLKLPWGAGAALKFMRYVCTGQLFWFHLLTSSTSCSFIDPTLEHDLTSNTRPWALSPLVATMPYFAHTPLDTNSPPPFPSETSLKDDVSQLNLGSPDSSPSRLGRRKKEPPTLSTASKRRQYFSQAPNRQAVIFGPNVSFGNSN